MHTLYTIDAAGVSAALGIPRQSILRHRAGIVAHPLLRGLPEPVMSRPRLVWLVADIDAWIESRRTFRPATPEAPTPAQPAEPPRKRGRPRNVAAAAAEGSAK